MNNNHATELLIRQNVALARALAEGFRPRGTLPRKHRPRRYEVDGNGCAYGALGHRLVRGRFE